MNILMATDALGIGGAETHILELCRALLTRGHRVTVLSRGGVYAEALLAAGATHIQFPYGGLRALLFSRAFIASLLTSGDFDVVHAHTRRMGFLFSKLCQKRRIPFVTTAHWTFSTALPKRLLSRWGDCTLAVSPDIRDYLKNAYGIPDTEIRVTVNGIDGVHFSPLEGERRPFEVVTVTRLDKGRSKTAEALIDLAPYLCRRLPDAHITVVGEGSEGKRLLEKAERVNLFLGREAVTMAGGTDDVLPYLRRAAVFVGASRAALEALSCGVVTLLSGDEGYLSLFTEENAARATETNFCFRGERLLDRETLLRDLLRALSIGEEERRRLSAFGRRFVTENYSPARMAEDALAVYAAAIRKKPRGVTLCGYYGYRNLGDEATLSAAIRVLRMRGYEEFAVLSRRGKTGKNRQGIYTVPRFSPRRVFLALRKSRRLVLGGGTLLQNETSRRSLFYYTAVMRLALFCGVPVEILSGGIGRITGRQGRTVARLLTDAAAVTLRTPRDVEDAKKLSPTCDARLLPDLVFSLPKPPQASAPRDAVAFSIRKEGDSDALLSAIIALKSRLSFRFVFVAMMPKDVGATRKYARATGGEAVVKASPDELAALLATARYAVGMRLHFLIFALRAQACPVSLFYDEKGEKFADFVNDSLQKTLIHQMDAKDNAIADKLAALLSAPPPEADIAAADAYLSGFYP